MPPLGAQMGLESWPTRKPQCPCERTSELIQIQGLRRTRHRFSGIDLANVVFQVYALARKQFVILDWRLDAPQDRRIDLSHPGSGNLSPHRERCLADLDVDGANRSLLV